MSRLAERVWAAQGDAWQAEGRLRTTLGGGAAELHGIRLMASGLPHAKWNSGDAVDPALVDWQEVHAWYSARAGGAGVPWGVRVPAEVPLNHGRFVFRQRCMGLLPSQFRTATAPAGSTIRFGVPADLPELITIDSAAFGDPPQDIKPWIAPHLGATGFTVAIAELDGAPVGCGTAILTDGPAGPSAGIFGVAVLEHARRRGIAGAVTAWLLERAFAAGADFAHLNPDSDAAHRLYTRLGFVETTGIDIYAGL
jgi:ribosomal protein S18 acetylase RimI-like enzyme